ncbi:MAG TPA: hypothetical protein VFU59_11230, partial [Candidatus Eisenbacteria bacterium]|nr:hypothetical protein [Candidatus Eisenbacteria bacterium]
MRKIVVLAQLWIVGALIAGWAVQAGDNAPRYPAGEPGRHAEAWFKAYNEGVEAMRAYVTAHVAPEALARRSVEARLDVYRGMREEHGALTPLRVTASD